MQTVHEVESVISFKESLYEINTEPSLPELNTLEEAKHRVLLVGRNGYLESSLFKVLENCAAEIVIASPSSANSEYVKNSDQALVLLESSATPECRKRLVAELLGSRVSLFYAYAVEIGCWWLPALLHGEDCHGSPAWRAGEFLLELRRLLREPFTFRGSNHSDLGRSI